MDFARARAIEFREEDALPAAKSELRFFDENELRDAGENGFDVRVGVAFSMAIGSRGWDEAIESAFGVGGDIGVGMFVDKDAGGSVRDVEETGAGSNAKCGDDALDVAGYVEQLRPARGFDGDGLHGRLQVYIEEGFLAQRVRAIVKRSSLREK